jgi:hypothetical protein
LLPLIDNQVSEAERAQIGERLIGAAIESSEEAVALLLTSSDPWLRSRAEIATSRAAEGDTGEREHAPAPASMDANAGAG